MRATRKALTVAVSAVVLLTAGSACGTGEPVTPPSSVATTTATPTAPTVSKADLATQVAAVGDALAKSGLTLKKPAILAPGFTEICNLPTETAATGFIYDYEGMFASVYGFYPDKASLVVDRAKAAVPQCPKWSLAQDEVTEATDLPLTVPTGVDAATGACFKTLSIAGEDKGEEFGYCVAYLARGNILATTSRFAADKNEAANAVQGNIARLGAALVSGVPAP